MVNYDSPVPGLIKEAAARANITNEEARASKNEKLNKLVMNSNANNGVQVGDFLDVLFSPETKVNHRYPGDKTLINNF